MNDYAQYSVFFHLNEEERKVFKELFYKEIYNIKHGIFINALFDSVDRDISSMFRIINLGVLEGSVNKTVLTNLKNFTKEVIVISNYNKHLEDGIINMVKLSKLERFSIAGISRLFILRTLQKYGIEYKTIKDTR